MKTIQVKYKDIVSKVTFSCGEIVEATHTKNNVDYNPTDKEYQEIEDLAWDEFLFTDCPY